MAEIVALQGELDLDPVVAERCEERHELACSHQRAGASHWIEAGRLHAENKREVGLGNWRPWCEKHDMTQTNADRLIRIAERFGGVLISEINNFDFTALSLLSMPSVPDATIAAAVEQAAEGRITKEAAEKLIAETRAAVEAEYDGKIVLTDEELLTRLDKIDRKYARKIESLENKYDQSIQQRDKARESLKKLQFKLKPDGDPSPLPMTFDKQTSFRAMCVEQAAEALRKELTITPRQLIDIETEMADKIHRQPELAITKLAELGGNAKAIVAWLRLFLDELGG